MKDKINEGRKFLKDRDLPGVQQIAQHKNFSQVMKGHSLVKSLFWKNAILWNSVLIGTAAAAVYLYNANNQDSPLQTLAQADTAQVQPFIVHPIPGKEIAFTSYRIDPTKAGEIKHSNGSILKIPAHVFQFKDGRPVQDPVELRYREFHDISDIFLSGIPMHYDSAGTRYTLESDGMIELRAFSGDEELVMNGTAPIEITMPCANNEKDFNFYSLDTVNKKWEYLGKAEPAQEQTRKKQTPSPGLNDFTSSFYGEEDLIRPAAANTEKYNFKINYDKRQFPELALYDNVLFEVTDNSFKASFYKIHWDNILLDNGDKKGNYSVKLKKADTSITVNAVPVFDEKNYGAASAKFREKHEQYLKKVKTQEAQANTTVASVNKDLQTYTRKDMLRTQRSMDVNATLLYTRTMRVNGTGIHNIDLPLLVLAPVIVPVALVTSLVRVLSNPSGGGQQAAPANKKDVKFDKIYLAEKGKNAVFSYSKDDVVKFNPAAKNLMWVMTDKNEFAFLQGDDFKKIMAGQSDKITSSSIKDQEEGLAFIKKFME